MSIEQFNEGRVLLNEGENEFMRSFAEQNDTGVDIELVTLDTDSAIRKFLDGNYSAWVTGIDSTTGDVARSCKNIIGLDKDKVLSSFFSMEKRGEDSFYLGDCALNHRNNPEKLVKVAEKTVESLKDLGETPKVAFLASPGEPDTEVGDVVGKAANEFHVKHPEVKTLGVKTWKEARAEGANTFFFGDLDAGNICYKIQNDPDGGDWQPAESNDPYVNILTKDGRTRYLSNYPVHTPTAEELVEFTVHAYNSAKDRMAGDRLPRVAMLSFATLKSAVSKDGKQPEEVAKIERAMEILQSNYPEMQIAAEGPLQWDLATDQRVYEKKTERPFRGEPDVLIFPTRDSGNLAYEMLQELSGGDRTAVGPIFQGLKGGRKVIDLSRGAREREIAGAVKTGGRSNVALKVIKGARPPEPADAKNEIPNRVNNTEHDR